MMGFALRNLKVFFRDKAAVFFSLLSTFIIIGLYALFLGDVWTSNYEGVPGIRYLMDSWIIAGLLTATSVTATMGAFGIMVEDRGKKVVKDFVVSPLQRRSMVGGYVLSAVTVGVVMSVVTVVLGEVYIVINGGDWLGASELCQVLGLILLSTLTNSAMVFFVVTFFSSTNAFATASTIIGTVIGFLTGIYLPIGSLPETVQWVVKLFPPSHAAALFRQVMMAEPMAEAFATAPAQTADAFREMMGVQLVFGSTEMPVWGSLLVLLATALLFYGLSVVVLSRKAR